MLYAAFTFWLAVIVITAWGVRELFARWIPPKALNVVLLPGTFVGLVGHVLALLVTGANVRELGGAETSSESGGASGPKPRIPILGPIIVGLIPLMACAGALYYAARALGAPLMKGLPADLPRPALPSSFTEIGDLLRTPITLAESFVTAAGQADLGSWRTIAFLYLLVCLSIRLAPFPGTARGTLGAIALVGAFAACISWFTRLGGRGVEAAWPHMTAVAGALFAMLLLALLLRGTILGVQIIKQNR